MLIVGLENMLRRRWKSIRTCRISNDIFAQFCTFLQKFFQDSEQLKEKRKIYLCFINYTKASACVDHNKLWKILKEIGIPDHLICLLRNLYVGQEAIVRLQHGIMDWFQIGKGIQQDHTSSPCLFIIYSEHIM